MKKNKGFTLIELLVVIAIIGILASVVLASLNSARAKGANAAVKSNLANMRAQAAVFYDSQSPNTYEGLCIDANVTQAMAAVLTAAGAAGSCYDGADTWVIKAPLKAAEGTDTSYCVDSSGKSIGIDATRYTAIVDETTLCSA